MSASLVGSEMCIRDSLCTSPYKGARTCARARTKVPGPVYEPVQRCLDLCTSSYKGARTFV
eukprot:13662798-Alexandrium_andersonii.AAC.1